jgi:hypothetical protein
MIALANTVLLILYCTVLLLIALAAMQFTPLYVGVPPYFQTSPPLGGGFVDPVRLAAVKIGCQLLVAPAVTIACTS